MTPGQRIGGLLLFVLLVLFRSTAVVAGVLVVCSPFPSLLERAAVGLLGWGLWWASALPDEDRER